MPLKDKVPTHDNLLVTRMRAAGAIFLGKTNVPEFGAGPQTFNRVFGATRNPYDLTKTCGASSGGAAVALSCGMVPVASGSDSGESLPQSGRLVQHRRFQTFLSNYNASIQGHPTRTRRILALNVIVLKIIGQLPNAGPPNQATDLGAARSECFRSNFQGRRGRLLCQ